jgi:hypothetical protein
VSFISVLTVVGKSAVGDGGVTGLGHTALRVLMVLPVSLWPGWAGLILALVVLGIGALVVLLLARSRDRAGAAHQTNRFSDKPRPWNGRVEK